jgi:hypothetical protein
MRTITIPEDEYLKIQQSIRDLKKEAELIQNDDFIKKLSFVYQLLRDREIFNKEEKISLKRGSGRKIITYIAEDFDEPLDDFREYME